MNFNETCAEGTWVQHWGHHAVCILPPGHAGLHWDDEGWEW